MGVSQVGYPQTCHSLRTRNQSFAEPARCGLRSAGLEVDFLMPRTDSDLRLVEAKAGKTVRLSTAAPLLSCIGPRPNGAGG